MSKIVDLTNQRFGRLVALRKGQGKPNRKISYWECACDCGNIISIRVDHLRSSKIQSCGCMRKESIASVNYKHGLSKTPEYLIWKGMISRCYNKRHISYPRYGARGITISSQWRTNFLAFLEDMGPRPSSAHSIERRNNEEGYSKNNCYWATQVEQANNTRTNAFYVFDGERKTLTQWCREYEINYDAMKSLIARGATFEDALDHTVKRTRKKEKRS